jgi:hypothetical protein
MTGPLLLPTKYKKVGWCIFIPSLILGLLAVFTNYEPSWLEFRTFSIFPGDIDKAKPFSLITVNLTNTVVGVLLLAGALLVGFTKEKNEDEFIAKLRLSSLMWAVLVNYLVLLFAFAFIYNTAFLNVMLYNMFTVLLIFIARFHYILYKNTKSAAIEK